MTDYIWWNTKMLIDRYPDELSKQRMRDFTRLFRDFLTEQGFVREGKFPPITEPVPEDFLIRFSDLTDEGVAFVKDGTDRWLDSNDDIRKPISMRSLERTLKKFRG